MINEPSYQTSIPLNVVLTKTPLIVISGGPGENEKIKGDFHSTIEAYKPNNGAALRLAPFLLWHEKIKIQSSNISMPMYLPARDGIHGF